MPRLNSNPRYQQASGRCNWYCILFGVTAPGGSGLPHLHTSTPLDDSPKTADIHASVEFEPVISTSERPLWRTLCFIWCDSAYGSRPPQVRVSSGRVISPIMDRYPCFRGIRTHDLSRRAATLTDSEFYLVWQPPLGHGFIIHTKLLCMSDQSDNKQTQPLPSRIRTQRTRTLLNKKILGYIKTKNFCKVCVCVCMCARARTINFPSSHVFYACVCARAHY